MWKFYSKGLTFKEKLSVIKNFLISKNIKKLKFDILRNCKNYRDFSDDLLLSQIGYFGHHLEKALKHQNRDNRGKGKRDRLSDLLNEYKNRKINCEEINLWAQNLINYYDSSKKIYIKPSDKKIILKENKEFLKLIKNRVSTRFWQKKEVSDKVIKEIIEAGNTSSISCNRHSLRFIAVKNKIENIEIGDSNNQSIFKKAPLIIYVIGYNEFYWEKFANALDAGGSCTTILLASKCFGLDGCWMYFSEGYNQDETRKKLNLNKKYYIYSAIALGYKLENADKPPRLCIDRILHIKK